MQGDRDAWPRDATWDRGSLCVQVCTVVLCANVRPSRRKARASEERFCNTPHRLHRECDSEPGVDHPWDPMRLLEAVGGSLPGAFLTVNSIESAHARRPGAYLDAWPGRARGSRLEGWVCDARPML